MSRPTRPTSAARWRSCTCAKAPALGPKSDQLAGSLLAVDWLCGIDLGLPAAGELRLQLQLSTLLEPLRSLLDKLFVGRSDRYAG